MMSKQLNELDVHPGITARLLKLGYKRLGAGQDQIAFLEPSTGLILKIFGTNKSGNLGFTFPQKTFKLFADYCQANPNNSCLPQFFGWETFVYNNKHYLQIRMERLFPFADDELPYYISELVPYAIRSKTSDAKNRLINKWMNPMLDRRRQHILITLGEDGFNQFWDTIYDLNKIAKSNGVHLDLHPGNFMSGSDGEIVISDPFFSGWGEKRNLPA